ncbi:MAG: porin [Phycisphaerales bacterium]|nr:porin [Phycisphaerales bacterium]
MHARIQSPSRVHRAALLLGLVVGASAVHAEDVTADDPAGALAELATEIEALRARNGQLADRLDTTEGATWLNRERTAEIRGIVADVLADSQARTSLQASGITSGYAPGEGFHLASADGGFTLRVEGQIQVRWVLNHNPSGQDYSNKNFAQDNFLGTNTVNGSKNGWGFQIRRAKVQFKGSVLDDSWRYQINGQFSGRSGEFSFEDVMITKHFDNGLAVTLGQFKAPFTREELVSSRRQLAVERSLVNAFFGAGRGVGVDLRYRNDDLSLEGYYGNGVRTTLDSSTLYTNSGDDPTEYAFAGRFQWKLAGDWSQFRGFNAGLSEETAVMIGLAGMTQKYNQNASADTLLAPVVDTLASYSGVGNLDGTNVSGVTADISAKFENLSFFGAVVWQQFDLGGSWESNSIPTQQQIEGSLNPWGFLVQGGYALTETFELFARYEHTNIDLGSVETVFLETPLGKMKTSVITLGVNHFINDNVKFTADWGIDLQSPMVGVNEGSIQGLGWGFTNARYQWVLRGQIQLLF